MKKLPQGSPFSREIFLKKSDLNFGKEVTADKDKNKRNNDQYREVDRQAEMAGADQKSSQTVHTIREGIETGDDINGPGQVIEREEGAGQEEERHDQKVHD